MAGILIRIMMSLIVFGVPVSLKREDKVHYLTKQFFECRHHIAKLSMRSFLSNLAFDEILDSQEGDQGHKNRIDRRSIVDCFRKY